MKLKELLLFVKKYKIYGKSEIDIKQISDDSRKIGKDCLFVAIKGLHFDAHNYIDQVIGSGAVAVVGEISPKRKWLDKITYIKTKNSRLTLALLASAWNGNPSKKMKIIGVTGTDGKTTTVNLIYTILKSSGIKVGMTSTIEARVGNKIIDTGLHVSSPEPLILQKLLKSMVDEGCTHAVLEVTSHGLDQERIAGIDFTVGVLTNITSEHLDYHNTFQNYLFTKCKLFESVKIAVLNQDDAYFESFKCVVPYGSEIISYGLSNSEADINAESIKYSDEGSEFDVLVYDDKAHLKKYQIKSKLLGDYNVSNVLAATGAVYSLGIGFRKIKRGILYFQSPEGRLQTIKNKKGLKVYIDFAHTPNALENVLRVLKKNIGLEGREGKLITVFGCAGERDKAKRPVMAEISTRIADFSVFTVEDSRNENVEDIISAMASGIKRGMAIKIDSKKYDDSNQHIKEHVYFKIPERGRAIWFAIQKLAKKGDVLVICGKGHEKSMAYNGIEYPWSDYKAATQALKGEILKAGYE